MANLTCKYSEWLTEYTFENCKLNREEYGDFLFNYIIGEKDGFVLNLNGSWGSGKTQFLRRLYSKLNKENHPCLYIDAWESDFSDIPLSVVSSELINQLSILNGDIGGDLEKVGQFLGKVLKGSIIGGAGLISKSLFDDAASGRELAKGLFEQSPTNFLEKIKNDHVEQIDAIKQIRIELGQLAEVLQSNYKYSLPIVVLIDELDRCRPNYAIEMLEVIKHFFTTKNFVFVVATDTTQLTNSVKAIYGSEFDSHTYLKRFFDREARLPAPSIDHYLECKNIDLSDYSNKVVLYPNIKSDDIATLKTYIEWIAIAHDLSIRDIDQLIGKLLGCLRTALAAFETSENIQFINTFNLVSAIVEFDKNIPEFNLRSFNNSLCKINVMNNLVLDEELGFTNKFLNIYEINMKTSIMYPLDIKDGWGETISHHVYATHTKLNCLNQNLYNGLTLSVFKNIKEIFQIAKQDEKNKIWLWNDYKKVVELAGNIH